MTEENKWGGTREGAGRKKSENPRGQHQIRATNDEWEVIKEFAKLTKTDIEKARKLVNEWTKETGL